MARRSTTFTLYSIADISKGGLDDLEWYLNDHPHTKLVTFDIIGRAMSLNPKADARDEVYKALSPLQRLATERGIGIIALHHLSQQSSEGKLEDELDGVYGSSGYTQVADTVMMLKRRRGSNTATLYITGRDVSEYEYNLRWWPELLSWAVTGDDAVEQVASSTPYEMGRFIEAIEKLGPTARRKDLANELSLYLQFQENKKKGKN